MPDYVLAPSSLPSPVLAAMPQAPSPMVMPAAPSHRPLMLVAPTQADGRQCWTALQVCEQVPSLSRFAAAMQARPPPCNP